MKKLFSMLMVVALLATLTIGASAATVTVTVQDVDATSVNVGETFEVPVYLSDLPGTGSITAYSFSISYDVDAVEPAKNARGAFAFVTANTKVYNWNTSQNETPTLSQNAVDGSLEIAFLDTTGGSLCYERDFGFSSAEPFFTLKFKKLDSDVKSFDVEVTYVEMVDFLMDGEPTTFRINSGLAVDGATITLGEEVDEGPAKTTIAGATNDIATGNTLADGSVTDVQVGTGIGVKFNQPAGMAGASSIEVKWSVNNGTKRVYSAEATDITAAIAGIAEGSPVVLAATFLNGTHTAGVNNSDVVAATAPGAIFKAVKADATAYFFTNAADNN